MASLSREFLHCMQTITNYKPSLRRVCAKVLLFLQTRKKKRPLIWARPELVTAMGFHKWQAENTIRIFFENYQRTRLCMWKTFCNFAGFLCNKVLHAPVTDTRCTRTQTPVAHNCKAPLCRNSHIPHRRIRRIIGASEARWTRIVPISYPTHPIIYISILSRDFDKLP